jgi:hypothetical protein
LLRGLEDNTSVVTAFLGDSMGEVAMIILITLTALSPLIDACELYHADVITLVTVVNLT